MGGIDKRLNELRDLIDRSHNTGTSDPIKHVMDEYDSLIYEKFKSQPRIVSYDRISKKNFLKSYPKSGFVVQKIKLVDNNHDYMVAAKSYLIYPTVEIYNKYKDQEFKPIIEYFDKAKNSPSQLHMEFDSFDTITDETSCLELYKLIFDIHTLIVDYNV